MRYCLSTMRKRNIVAWVCIVAPWVPLLVVLVVFAITGFIISETVVSEVATAAPGASSLDMIGRIVNVVLGLLGVLAVLGIPIGAGVGVYLLSTKQGATIKPEQP